VTLDSGDDLLAPALEVVGLECPRNAVLGLDDHGRHVPGKLAGPSSR
jgi:hypothetical protein